MRLERTCCCHCRTYGPLCTQTGPHDAQCKLLDFMLENSFESCDVSHILNVIDSLTTIVHQHLLNEERLVCHSATDNTSSSRGAYFGGLMGSMLRSANGGRDNTSLGGDCSRDALMCRLLRLVNALVQVPVGRAQSTQSAVDEDLLPFVDASSLTDTNKISQAFGESTGSSFSSALVSASRSCFTVNVFVRSASYSYFRKYKANVYQFGKVVMCLLVRWRECQYDVSSNSGAL